MGPLKRASLELIGAIGLTAGLIGVALVVSGHAVHAGSPLGPAPGEAGDVAPLPGATVAWRRVVLDGAPTRVRECRAPSRGPKEVLDHYAEVARQQTTPGAPFAVLELPWGGAVRWRGTDGRPRAVLVEPLDGGGATYRILVGDGDPAVGAERGLPAGLELPGFTPALTLEQPSGALLLLDAAAPPREAADAVLAELGRRGQRSDSLAPAADGGVTAALRDARGAPVGRLVATPRDDGGSRVSLTLPARRR